MKKKAKKQRRTMVPIQNPLTTASKKRLPKKSVQIWFDSKGTSKYHW